MPSAGENASLSLPARILTFIGPISVIVFMYSISLVTGTVSFLAFIPVAFVLWLWHRNNKTDPPRRGELEHMVWIFFGSGTIGVLCLTGSWRMIFSLLTRVLYGSGEARDEFVREFHRTHVEGLSEDELAKRAALAATLKNMILCVVLSLGPGAFLEGILLYLPVAYAKWRRTPRYQDRVYLDFALAGGMGMAFAESIISVRGFAATEQSWRGLASMAFQQTISASFFRFILASYTAVRAIRGDYLGDDLTWWECVRPAVIIQGCRLITADIFRVLDGQVGLIFPTDDWISIGMYLLVSLINSCSMAMALDAWESLGRRDGKRKLTGQHNARKEGLPLHKPED